MAEINSISKTLPLLIVAFVAACSTPTWTSPAGSTTYQIGYRDGCDAGYAVAGSPLYERVDDAELTQGGEQYLLGWAEGYNSCKRSYDRIQATIHSILGA